MDVGTVGFLKHHLKRENSNPAVFKNGVVVGGHPRVVKWALMGNRL